MNNTGKFLFEYGKDAYKNIEWRVRNDGGDVTGEKKARCGFNIGRIELILGEYYSPNTKCRL